MSGKDEVPYDWNSDPTNAYLYDPVTAEVAEVEDEVPLPVQVSRYDLVVWWLQDAVLTAARIVLLMIVTLIFMAITLALMFVCVQYVILGYK